MSPLCGAIGAWSSLLRYSSRSEAAGHDSVRGFARLTCITRFHLLSLVCSSLGTLAELLTSTPAFAYRPFDSTDAGVADYGALEFEIGSVGYLHMAKRSSLQPIQIVNLGFLPDWELVLQAAEPTFGSDGLGRAEFRLANTSLTAKYVLRDGCLQGKSGPSLASELGVLLPTLKDEAGTGATLSLLASERAAIGAVHVNLVASRTRASNPDVFASTILEGPASWRVRPVGELYYEREFRGDRSESALLGAIAELSRWYAVDSAVRVASISGGRVFELRAGFTWVLPVFH